MVSIKIPNCGGETSEIKMISIYDLLLYGNAHLVARMLSMSTPPCVSESNKWGFCFRTTHVVGGAIRRNRNIYSQSLMILSDLLYMCMHHRSDTCHLSFGSKTTIRNNTITDHVDPTIYSTPRYSNVACVYARVLIQVLSTSFRQDQNIRAIHIQQVNNHRISCDPYPAGK